MHPSNKISIENINDICFWHNATLEDITSLERVAKVGKEFMEVILLNCPDCADRDKALSDVRSARMWANSSICIANNEVDHTREKHLTDTK